MEDGAGQVKHDCGDDEGERKEEEEGEITEEQWSEKEDD